MSNNERPISAEEEDTEILRNSSNIYREYILDHYANPRNKGTITHPTGKAKESNPLCGDEITVFIRIENNILVDIGFTGDGCAISQAAMSILSEQVKELPVDKIGNMQAEDIKELIGLELTPTRMRCALLGLHTLKKAIRGDTDE